MGLPEHKYTVYLTGHRHLQKDKETGKWFSKLAWEGISPSSDVLMWRLVDLFRAYFKAHPEVDTVISGMADGVDIAGAIAAIAEGRKVWAFKPYNGHEKGKSVYKEYYDFVMLNAWKINNPDTDYYDGCLTQRNLDMINAGDFCLALHDGSMGGTGHCVRESKKAGKEVVNLWNAWVKNRATKGV